MMRLERASSRLIGKLFFSQDYLSPELLFLILLFCLILTWLILFKKKEDFASPPSSPIFAYLSAIFITVLASGPTVVQGMENPPGPGPSEAGPSADRGEPSSAPLPVETPDFAKQLLDVERRRL